MPDLAPGSTSWDIYIATLAERDSALSEVARLREQVADWRAELEGCQETLDVAWIHAELRDALNRWPERPPPSPVEPR